MLSQTIVGVVRALNGLLEKTSVNGEVHLVKSGAPLHDGDVLTLLSGEAYIQFIKGFPEALALDKPFPLDGISPALKFGALNADEEIIREALAKGIDPSLILDILGATASGIGAIGSGGDSFYMDPMYGSGLIFAGFNVLPLSFNNFGSDLDPRGIVFSPSSEPDLAEPAVVAGVTIPPEVIHEMIIGDVTEAGGSNNSIAGSVFEGQLPVIGLIPRIISDRWGTLTIENSGKLTYELSNNSPVVDALKKGEVLEFTFAAELDDDTSIPVLIRVHGANDAAVAIGDTLSTPEDTVLTGNVLDNDHDPESDILTITGFKIKGKDIEYQPGQKAIIEKIGELTIDIQGFYTFTPDANYHGPVPVVTYTITDGSISSSSTLNITITSVDDPFSDADEALNVAEDNTLNGNVLSGTSSVDGAVTVTTFSVAGIATIFDAGQTATIVGMGTLQINADGAFIFKPEANFNGPVPLVTYTMTDGNSEDHSTLTLVVDPVSDAPVDGDETIIVTEDTTLTVPVTEGLLNNATDGDDNPLTITNYTIAGMGGVQPLGTPVVIAGVGTITINANGSYSFAPAANYTGAVPVITYTISDGVGGTDTSTLTLTMEPVNDVPVDGNEANTVTEDTTLTVTAVEGLLINASDVEINPLTISGYTIAGIGGDQPVGIPVAIAGIGSITINADGGYSFVPEANYSGTVPVITYTISDGAGGTDTSTLELVINAVADMPELIIGDIAPPGNGFTKYTWTDSFKSLKITNNGNGENPDTLQSIINNAMSSNQVTPPSISTVTNVELTGNSIVPVGTASLQTGFIYLEAGTPYKFSGYGDDSIKITVGTTFSVGTTWGAGNSGQFNSTFTPTTTGYYVINIYHNNSAGPGNYDVNLNNINLSTTNYELYKTVSDITDGGIQLSNLDPGGFYAGFHLNHGNEDTPIALSNIAANLMDTDGSEAFQVTISGIPVGSVLRDGTHTFTSINGIAEVYGWNLSTLTITPPLNYNGNFTLVVEATATETSNGDSETKSALINVVVYPVNDLPEAVPDSLYAQQGTSITYNANQLLLNDTDIDSANLTIASVVSGAGGTAVLNANGTVTFTPNANFNGDASFTYTVSDGLGTSNTATVNVNVVGVTSVSSPSAIEGNALVYSVNLNAASNVSTTFAYSLGGGTASSIDYAQPTFSNGVILSNGFLTVPAGVTSFTVTIPTINDVINEGNETVLLTVGTKTGTGSITDNDLPPQVSISDVSVDESAGTATFTVSLTAVSGLPVSVDYNTSNGTAVSGSDFYATNGILNFAPGDVTKTIVVSIIDDSLFEGNETFNVNLSNAINATIADSVGMGTIGASDIPVITLTPDAVSVKEDNKSTGNVLTNDNSTLPITVTSFSVSGMSGPFNVGYLATISNVGTFTIDTEGAFTFSPMLNYNGAVPQITYNVTDGNSNSSSNLNITVTPINDDPVAEDDLLPVINVSNLQTVNGLEGYFYNYTPGNMHSYYLAANYINSGGAGGVPAIPDASFVSTVVYYGTGDLNNNLGGYANPANDNLKIFLGSDSASLDRATTKSTPQSILHMEGLIHLDAGTYNFQIRGDDGYIIIIDGNIVAGFTSDQSPTSGLFKSFTLANSGLHEIEIYYYDQGGRYVLQAELQSVVGGVGQGYHQLGTALDGDDNGLLYRGDTILIDTAVILGNDTDVDHDDLSIVPNSLVSSIGVAALDNFGHIVVSGLPLGYTGTITIDYKTKDTLGATSNSATITVKVDLDAPSPITVFPSNLQGTIYEDTSITAEGMTAVNIEGVLGLSAGSLSQFNPPGSGASNDPGNVTAIDGNYASNTYWVGAGQAISLDWTFNNAEKAPGQIAGGRNDLFLLMVKDYAGNIVQGPQLITSSEQLAGAAVANGTFNYVATSAGAYVFTWIVVNGENGNNDSTATLSSPNAAPVAVVDLLITSTIIFPNNNDMLAITIAGIAGTAFLSAGINQGGGTWLLTPEELHNLKLISTEASTYNLSITATAEDDAGNISSITSNMQVKTDVIATGNIYEGAWGVDTISHGSDTAAFYYSSFDGHDNLTAGSGNDLMYGGAGNDNITGGSGNDVIHGETGDDNIFGGDGNDLLFGEAGIDTLAGNNGNDSLYGGAGNDNLNGGLGYDTLIGGSGNDSMTGGGGLDIFIWRNSDFSAGATDTITDFKANPVNVYGDASILNLSDLLSGEVLNADSLDSYLNITKTGTNSTTITIDPNGTQNFSPATAMSIILSGVDLTAVFFTSSSHDIVNHLITNGNLIVDL
jgi:VCBS repeat-containing protein